MRPLNYALAGICVFGGLCQAQLENLTFRPVAAEYSVGLDRIIMISSNPDQLHIYNPVYRTDTAVAIPPAPLSLSVSTDGMHAAVGHSTFVSYVNLLNGTVDRIYPIPSAASGVALTSSYVYAVGNTNGNSTALSLNLSTGATSTASLYGGPNPRYSAITNRLYVTTNASSSLSAIDVSGGALPAYPVLLTPTNGATAACGKIMFSPDYVRIYSTCAAGVARSSTAVSQDTTYISSLPIATNNSVADSPLRGLAAVIANGTNDTEVRLFDNAHFSPAGRFSLAPFTVGFGSASAHGRWVFFSSDSSNLFVISQADSTSNLLNDFAIQTIPLDTPAACSVTLPATSASVISSGATASLAVTAAADCVYQPASQASWIQVIAGAYGSGNGSISYIARPNAGPARAGTISIGGQTFTVNQDAAGSPSALYRFGHTVVAADYSRALDKIVLVSSAPNELHLFDAGTLTDQIVPLEATPSAVTVSPDGSHAAVGHDGSISYVNLQTGSVDQVYPAMVPILAVGVSSNGYIYGLTRPNYGTTLLSLSIGSGSVSVSTSSYSAQNLRIRANQRYLYTDAYSGGPWNISAGVATPISLYSSYISLCSNLWLSETGDRLFSACGNVYRTSDSTTQDLVQYGSLAGTASVTWLANAGVLGATAAISGGTSPFDTEVRFFGDQYLGYAGSLAVPSFTIGARVYAGHGRYVFWNSLGTKLYVIEKADSTAGLVADTALYSVTPSIPGSGCTFTLGGSSASIPATGGFGGTSMTTGTGCVWSAQPTASAPWLTIALGSFAVGPGSVTYSATSNLSTSPRTAVIMAGGQSLTLTQAGAVTSAMQTKLAIYRPGAYGTFFIDSNGNGSYDGGSDLVTSFGIGSDIPVSGDWNHSGHSKIGVYRNGTWFLDYNGDGHWNGNGVDRQFSFGIPGDVPIVGDWDNSGTDKIGIYRAGVWYVDYNGNGVWDGPVIDRLYFFGIPGDVPIFGDWTGTGRKRIGVYRYGVWFLDINGDTIWNTGDANYYFGIPGDIPVVGDWDSTGKTKLGIYRQGHWFLDKNGNGVWEGAPTDLNPWFGIPGDVPVVGVW